jgi:hypothetical protein
MAPSSLVDVREIKKGGRDSQPMLGTKLQQTLTVSVHFPNPMAT